MKGVRCSAKELSSSRGQQGALRVGTCPDPYISKDHLGGSVENKERPRRRSCRLLGERRYDGKESGGTLSEMAGSQGVPVSCRDGGTRGAVGQTEHPFSWEALPDAHPTPSQGRCWSGKQ